MPDFHRLNKSRTAEMNSEELNKRLKEEAERSAARNKQKKHSNTQSRKQQKISEQTKKQLPPQSPARKQREQELKRQEKEASRTKRRRRRGSYIVYYVMLAVLALIIFAILSVTVLFNTEQILVYGESDYTDEQIIAASGLKGNENLVTLSTSGIPERILDMFVALDSVKVEKSFPSTIKITVERSVPMAIFTYAGKNYVISHIGRVMKIGEDEADCMHVIGYHPAESVDIGSFITAEDPEQDKLVADISAAIEKAELTGIDTVDITDKIGIVLTYDKRVLISIGSALDLDKKMAMAKELLTKGHIGETEHVTLDLTNTISAVQRPITSAPQTTEPAEETEEGEDGENETTGALDIIIEE